ncbi:MAG: hypothetical protein AAGF67_09090 [Verrucomicrobiota bacterium]
MKLSFLLPLLAAFLVTGCETMESDVVTEEAHLGIQKEFQVADTDKNGSLSHGEVASYHHRQELAIYDLDGDGHISKNEWSTSHAEPTDNLENFNQADKDGDGQISSDEAVTFVTQHVAFGDMMKEFDENGDSNLHWAEIEAGIPTEVRVTLFSFHPANS